MSSNTATRQARAPLRGFAAVRHSLDEQGVQYGVVPHERTHCALEDARVSGVPPHRVVKTIAVWANGRLQVVALPAAKRLDLHRVRQLLGDNAARLATEDEMTRHVADLDAGALPPFGAPAPPLVLVDRRVLSCNWVLANGGDHCRSLRVSPLEIVRISHARVVDIGES
ncbi:MAG: Ala-tRNA(Pro) deacylase [Solirubrobacteraceae bacterium]|jgi:prolyl-tRNA editing enzyme YbaK/EbsC (Cys-tRNA(Pro) deacylase)|nr:Ala-tRNA(Pro) deacylase [Solirubrobacteraceae bacterium]